MEETLGRRISANRKKQGMTQEMLAEQLGVTAQAVSKWENDQSCPDIAMLPKLSAIFGTTIDALLGVSQDRATEEKSEVVFGESTQNSVSFRKRTGAGSALWLLLTGGIMMIMEVFPGGTFHMPLWKTAGLSALFIYGLFGIYPRFNLFRLCYGLWGGYCLYCGVWHPAIYLNIRLWTSVLLISLGISILLDTLRGKQLLAGHMSVEAAGKNLFEYAGNSFLCSTFFGSDQRMIRLPELEGGEGNVLFGELCVDIRECGSVGLDCSIVLRCLFGSLTLYVPRGIRLQCVNKTFFGVVQECGQPDGEITRVICVENNAGFGRISIKYI